MKIQHMVFHDGSYVLHKIMIDGSKYSAWFYANGELQDCERISTDGNTRVAHQVRSTDTREAIARIGLRYMATGGHK